MTITTYLSADAHTLNDAKIIMDMHKNLLLKGPTGSGKTKLAESLSAYLKQPMHSINCSVDLDAESILGFKTIEYDQQGKQQIVFVDGPVIKAMKEGHLLYIDEINMAKAETLPILNSVLDYRRRLTNPYTGEVIVAQPGFNVIAAINEGYIGTLPMNEAFKNRFVVLHVDYAEGQVLKNIIQQQSQLQDEQIIDTMIKLTNDIRIQVKNGQISEDAASIRAILDACDLATKMPVTRAIQRAIIDKLEDEREQQAVYNIMYTWFEEEI